MAKDGTNRGGRRVRAGAKPEPLNEKLAAGRPATRLTAPAELDVFDLDGTDICLGLQLLGLVCLSSWHMHSAGLWPHDAEPCTQWVPRTAPTPAFVSIVTTFGPCMSTR